MSELSFQMRSSFSLSEEAIANCFYNLAVNLAVVPYVDSVTEGNTSIKLSASHDNMPYS